MSSSIEVLQIDRRYEDCRVRDAAREARLLANIAERGIQQPLAGVWTGGVFILLDGFKRLRAAERLQIHAVPRRSLGDEEALGILRLMRSEKQTALNVFEEARFIERLVNVHQMSPGDIAAQVNRSKAWVSVRRNWTFLGHPQAAAGRLKLFSIASSAHRHGLMVHDYFEDVLAKLAHAQQREPQLLEPGSEYLQALLPDHWARANPGRVCHDRLRERDEVAESRQIRYLRRQLAGSACGAD